MAARLRRFASRLRLGFGSRRAEEELAREIAAHLALLEDEYRRRGLSEDEARHAARRAMGSVEVVKELHREARSFVWLAAARQDVELAVRALVRSRRVTALAILTLGLGIGATTVIYTALDAALFRPLPFPRPGELVQVRGLSVPLDLRDMIGRAGHSGRPPKTSLDVTDLAAMSDVFTNAGAHATGNMNLGSGPAPLRVDVTFVTDGFFAVMGRAPQYGRVFVASESVAGGPPVVVLSDRLWRTHFGADRGIVGRTVRLDTVPHEVIGIMPADFRFPGTAQLWVPLPVPAPMSVMGAFRNFLPGTSVARLAPGVTAAAAAVRVEAAQRELGTRTTSPPSSLATVVSLQQSLVGDRQTALVVLMASAGLLLVIACANTATLLLAQAAVRRREMATHAVLGASRGRLMARLLVESVVLAGAGALLGIVLAAASVSLLPALLPPGLASLAPPQIDLRVLTFAVVVTLVTGIAFGLWPSLGGSRIQLRTALQDAGGRTVTAGRVSRSLVVTQVALACVLTSGAALMLTSLRSILAVDVGMRVEEIATARINLPSAAYRDAPARAAFVRAAVEGIGASPSIAAAAAVNTLPLANEAYVSFRLDYEGATDRDTSPARYSSPYLVVSPGYFRAVGIPLVRGRDLAWSDSASMPVAVINRTMAQRFWPGEDPIGKRFLMTDLRTVVGVVADAHVRRLDTEVEPQVYLPIQDQPQSYVSLVARYDDQASLSTVTDRIRATVHRIDPELPLYAAQPMTAVIAEALAPRRLNTVLLTMFGVAALGLAAVGVYGVLACSVAQRRREIGVRVALGADRRQILALVLRQGATLVAAGIIIGIAATLIGARYMQAMLYGVGTRDPVTLVSVAVLLGTIGLLASAVPARQAATAEPLDALRAE